MKHISEERVQQRVSQREEKVSLVIQFKKREQEHLNELEIIFILCQERHLVKTQLHHLANVWLIREP